MSSIKDRILQFDQRRKYFRSLSSATRILDIGCGGGKNAQEVHGLHPSIEIHGVDLLDDANIPSFIKYRKLDLDEAKLPYADATFDGIVLAHVLEHLTKARQLGPELNRVLRPGGSIYVEAPNWTSILIPSLAINRSQLNTLNFFDDHTHIKPWSKQGIYEYLTLCCKLQVQRVGTVRNWLRIPLDPFLILVSTLFPNRGVVASALWNLTGWRIYGIAKKL
jgi:ubiquinone/menaquinone biosynthesis C-methylase UbiE